MAKKGERMIIAIWGGGCAALCQAKPQNIDPTATRPGVHLDQRFSGTGHVPMIELWPPYIRVFLVGRLRAKAAYLCYCLPTSLDVASWIFSLQDGRLLHSFSILSRSDRARNVLHSKDLYYKCWIIELKTTSKRQMRCRTTSSYGVGAFDPVWTYSIY